MKCLVFKLVFPFIVLWMGKSRQSDCYTEKEWEKERVKPQTHTFAVSVAVCASVNWIRVFIVNEQPTTKFGINISTNEWALIGLPLSSSSSASRWTEFQFSFQFLVIICGVFLAALRHFCLGAWSFCYPKILVRAFRRPVPFLYSAKLSPPHAMSKTLKTILTPEWLMHSCCCSYSRSLLSVCMYISFIL